MGSMISKTPPVVEEETETQTVVKKYVQELLRHKSINNALIPDVIEAKIYEDIFNVVIGNLKKILSDAKIEVLDHEIRFTITPINGLIE
jgi:predicted metal-binding protein